VRRRRIHPAQAAWYGLYRFKTSSKILHGVGRTSGAEDACLSGMSRNHSLPTILLAGILAAGTVVGLHAQNSTQPDNTKNNRQEATNGAVTADQQKNDRSDREVTKEIRKSVMSDKSLSTDAHNVKVITRGGAVTLKGPVNSEDERKTIVAKAEQVAGTGNVTDQLTVKSAQ
jgi:hyperosmotically inducible periplasmic protein